MDIRVSGVVEESIVDGPGIRYVIFTQGCVHDCKGCHNVHTHDLQGGELRTCEELVKDFTADPLLDGITLSGGEPVLQSRACAYLAGEARNAGLNVVTYSGYTFEELYMLGHKDADIMTLLHKTDILIDGKFLIEERDILLKFRGSANQRVIDVQKTLSQYEETKCVILYEFEEF